MGKSTSRPPLSLDPEGVPVIVDLFAGPGGWDDRRGGWTHSACGIGGNSITWRQL